MDLVPMVLPNKKVKEDSSGRPSIVKIHVLAPLGHHPAKHAEPHIFELTESAESVLREARGPTLPYDHEFH